MTVISFCGNWIFILDLTNLDLEVEKIERVSLNAIVCTSQQIVAFMENI